MKNYIGISRDHSASMDRIARFAARDYNNQIAAINSEATTQQIDTIVSVVKCGVGRGNVVRESVFSSVSVLKPIHEGYYDASGASTPLWDSIGDLISIMEQAPDALDPDVSFLVMAITDGEENSSRTWNRYSLMNKISQLQKTGRWTFVFRVPQGSRKMLIQFGIPANNILEWEQTEQGVEQASKATVEAISTYYGERARGAKCSTNFFTTDLSGVSSRTIQSKLTEITDQVQFWNVTADAQIRPFVEQKLGKPMVKGGAFYQLMKKEDEVQDYKVICIRDKKTGAVYAGVEARNLLGLPHVGTVKVAPGVHGGYDIFIQSTSVNRRLVAGTQLMYWERVGQPYQSQPKQVAKSVVSSSPVVSPGVLSSRSVPASPDYINGYKLGFVNGKKHNISIATTLSGDVHAGYCAGYKDGRGKKRNLYK